MPAVLTILDVISIVEELTALAVLLVVNMAVKVDLQWEALDLVTDN